MSALTLLVISVCLLAAEPAMAASSATPTPTNNNDIHIEATHLAIHQGLTQDLNITCSFHHQPGSDFNSLISLILSKSDGPHDSNFKEIAAITSVTPNNVTIKDAVGGHVSGQLVVNGQSYVTFQWVYPSSDVVGQYLCNANGFDTFGHLKVEHASINVSDKTVDHDTILAKIQQLESDLNAKLNDKQTQLDTQASQLIDKQRQLDTQASQLIDKQRQLDTQASQLIDKQRQVDSQASQLTGQKTQLDNQKSQLDTQDSQLSDVIGRIDESRAAMMEFSSSFRGHRYYVSRPIWHNIAVADSVCRLHGGYLLEINDRQEYDFVYNIVKNKGITQRVLIGGRDEVKEGTWKYLRSGQPVRYFIWRNGEPSNDGGIEDCMEIYAGYSWKMNDIDCLSQQFSRFMCEIDS